ncbi:hypothetical protein IL992_37350 [Microbispora sp. NEAU-D428]|uniref:hypothetical protein n=1 Tax=Microbispora sitophila TaxID=2771537 RepID=UPI0018672EB8|nr:hypothetical protein [Microbispora sitophila]MBE3014804.1 hypothetical protein [Microbispora sitophila]
MSVDRSPRISRALITAAVFVASACALTTGPASAKPLWQTVRAETPIDTTQYKHVEATCPAGTKLVGGGAHIGYASIPLAQAEASAQANSYSGAAYAGGTTQDPWNLNVTALCADVSVVLNLQYVNRSTPVNDTDAKSVTVQCPGTLRVLSTGFRIIGGKGDIRPVGTSLSEPASSSSAVSPNTAVTASAVEKPGYPGTWGINASAVCGTPSPNYEVKTAIDTVVVDPPATLYSWRGAVAKCTPGKQLYGIAGRIDGGAPRYVALQAFIADYAPEGTALLQAVAEVPNMPPWSATASAICG